MGEQQADRDRLGPGGPDRGDGGGEALLIQRFDLGPLGIETTADFVDRRILDKEAWCG